MSGSYRGSAPSETSVEGVIEVVEDEVHEEEEPTTLFYFNPSTASYTEIASPTPYIDEYFTYSPETLSYSAYEGPISYSLGVEEFENPFEEESESE
jgi:hypothetical protein